MMKEGAFGAFKKNHKTNPQQQPDSGGSSGHDSDPTGGDARMGK